MCGSSGPRPASQILARGPPHAFKFGGPPPPFGRSWEGSSRLQGQGRGQPLGLPSAKSWASQCPLWKRAGGRPRTPQNIQKPEGLSASPFPTALVHPPGTPVSRWAVQSRSPRGTLGAPAPPRAFVPEQPPRAGLWQRTRRRPHGGRARAQDPLNPRPRRLPAPGSRLPGGCAAAAAPGNPGRTPSGSGCGPGGRRAGGEARGGRAR